MLALTDALVVFEEEVCLEVEVEVVDGVADSVVPAREKKGLDVEGAAGNEGKFHPFS